MRRHHDAADGRGIGRAGARDAAEEHGDDHRDDGQRARACARSAPTAKSTRRAATPERSKIAPSQHEHRDGEQRILGDAGVDVGRHREQAEVAEPDARRLPARPSATAIGVPHEQDGETKNSASRDHGRSSAPGARARACAAARAADRRDRAQTTSDEAAAARRVDPLRHAEAGRRHLEAVVVPDQRGRRADQQRRTWRRSRASTTSSANAAPAARQRSDEPGDADVPVARRPRCRRRAGSRPPSGRSSIPR